MNAGNIHKFLKFLNVFHADEREDRWINCKCLFAKWNHVGGTDNSPSFGIRINPVGVSVYKCWACGKTGDLFTMLNVLKLKEKLKPSGTIYDWKNAFALVMIEEELAESCVFEEVDYESEEETKALIEFPSSWVKSFMTIEWHPYLTKRGVSTELAKEYDLRFDLGQNRLCFPIRGFDGLLYGMQGRHCAKNTSLPYLFYLYQGASNNAMWLGEHQANENELLILCEGMFDLFAIRRVFPNVIASMTSAIGPAKLARLKGCTTCISFYDWGTGGQAGRKALDKYFYKTDILMGHCYPTEDEGDPGNMTPERIAEELRSVIPWINLDGGY